MTTRRRDRATEIARSAIGPLSARGMHNVTLADIGASLGMTGAHLLYYFESKHDLFTAALRIVEDDLRAAALAAFEDLPTARQRWEWLLEVGAPSGLDDSGLLMWLEAWGEAIHSPEVRELISDLEERWQSLLRDALRLGIERGELPAGIEVDPIVEGVSALLDGLTLRVVVGYRPVDHTAAMAIVESFVGPLLPWVDVPVEAVTTGARSAE